MASTTIKSRRFFLAFAVAALSVAGYFALRTMRGLMMLGFVDSAIGRIHTIYAAEAQFTRAHPALGYTCTLSELPRGPEIKRLLASNRVDNGYAFEIRGCGAVAPNKPNLTYFVVARPLHAGQPAFCLDQSGILKTDEDGSVENCLARGTPLGGR